MLGFAFRRDVLIVNPSIAMARDFMTQFDECARNLRMAFDRHADAEYRQRQAALVEFAQNAPHAGARAVLVNRLHAHVARRKRRGADDLRKELLRAGVAVQHAVFAALFIVEDELHRNARPPGPVRLHRMAAIADQIAWIVRIE